MARTLIAYYSGYGQTRKIAEHLRDRMIASGKEVEVRPLDSELDPSDYACIVIGASIRNGKHKPPVHQFIRTHLALLEQRPSAFFSVNLVARKPHKNTPETNPYMQKFLEQSPWKPDQVEVFAGNLDYQRYTFSDRNIIRFIMWLTKGPTDPQTNEEFTDWARVDGFADRLSELAAGARPALGADA